MRKSTNNELKTGTREAMRETTMCRSVLTIRTSRKSRNSRTKRKRPPNHKRQLHKCKRVAGAESTAATILPELRDSPPWLRNCGRPRREGDLLPGVSGLVNSLRGFDAPHLGSGVHSHDSGEMKSSALQMQWAQQLQHTPLPEPNAGQHERTPRDLQLELLPPELKALPEAAVKPRHSVWTAPESKESLSLSRRWGKLEPTLDAGVSQLNGSSWMKCITHTDKGNEEEETRTLPEPFLAPLSPSALGRPHEDVDSVSPKLPSEGPDLPLPAAASAIVVSTPDRSPQWRASEQLPSEDPPAVPISSPLHPTGDKGWALSGDGGAPAAFSRRSPEQASHAEEGGVDFKWEQWKLPSFQQLDQLMKGSTVLPGSEQPHRTKEEEESSTPKRRINWELQSNWMVASLSAQCRPEQFPAQYGNILEKNRAPSSLPTTNTSLKGKWANHGASEQSSDTVGTRSASSSPEQQFAVKTAWTSITSEVQSKIIMPSKLAGSTPLS